ncbi:hypothetical protein [Mucilaginibacter sp.]|uniref:hypothetical protein n=1 Tax=Mucilaginibacter sp. TaxID=1882438 RepID=UPI00260ADE5D|nr:hypothetical protein [Mucilaginibacter sp.]MDB4919375.1 hypothetical protein [Mucilaginibacter sp.]
MNKILIYAALLSCLILGCKKKENSSKAGQAGVYELEKQVITGRGKDSTIKRTQIKIYTDRYFMYASMVPDSSVGFGVGTYTLDSGNRITERSIYTSRALDSSLTYKLEITGKPNGYIQSIPDYTTAKGVKYVLKEDYKKLASGDTSILDGLWKMEKTYTIKGKDTIATKVRQYKIFWGGHFIFIHRFPQDKAETKFKNGFGTGVFTFKDDMLREEEQISNYALLRNHKFAIKITLNGNDEYTQVINGANDEQSVEIYKRVK